MPKGEISLQGRNASRRAMTNRFCLGPAHLHGSATTPQCPFTQYQRVENKKVPRRTEGKRSVTVDFRSLHAMLTTQEFADPSVRTRPLTMTAAPVFEGDPNSSFIVSPTEARPDENAREAQSTSLLKRHASLAPSLARAGIKESV